MGMLTRKQVGSFKLRQKKVFLTNEDYVLVREMSGQDASLFEAQMAKLAKGKKEDDLSDDDLAAMNAIVVRCCLVDEKGKLWFTEKDSNEDVLATFARGADLRKVVDAARSLSGLLDMAKTEKAAEKNSESSQS